jgi:hypothetical protein
VSNEHAIFDAHTLAHETVTGNFATVSNACVLLYFHERAYFAIVSNFASIEVYELAQAHVLSELYVIGYCLTFH